MLLLLSFLIGVSAWTENLNPSPAEFAEVCREARRSSAAALMRAPAVGEVGFFPTIALQATQTRFSFARFLGSMAKALREKREWYLRDNGNSIFAADKNLRLAYYRGALYIVDGHHRALISTYLNARTVPGEIIADLSHLEYEPFLTEMEARGWAHWRNHHNQRMRPVDLCDMADDPNFLLVRKFIRRVSTEGADEERRLATSTGAPNPIAVKINADMPFFEIHLADALRRGGVDYDGDGEKIPRRYLRKYLKILRREAADKSSPLAKVLLLDKPKAVAKLKLEQIVLKHLEKCERDLR